MDLDQDDWKHAFMAELRRLRLQPHDTVAAAIAFREYTIDVNPKVAAQRYHASRPLAAINPVGRRA